MKRCFACLVAGAISCSFAFGQEARNYMGARAVLSQMRTPPKGSALADPKVLFADELVAFGDRVGTLPPQQAASEWLGFVHRAFVMSDAQPEDRPDSHFADVLKVLPSPDSWPLIEQALQRGDEKPRARSLSLLLLLDVLQSNHQAAWARLKAIDAEPHIAEATYYLNPIKLDLAIRSHDADALESVLRHEADSLKEATRYRWGGGPSIAIPDLVPLLGADRAAKLLTYILFTAKAELSFEYGGDARSTAELARKITIREASRVAWPQWTLASSPDAGTLFLTFRKRFPKAKMGIATSEPASWSTYQGAAVHCLANLFVSGRLKEAKEFAASYADVLSLGWFGLGDESFSNRLRQTAKMGPFLSFLGELALQHPDSSLSSLYMSLASPNQDPAGFERFLKRFIASATQSYRKQNARIELRSLYLSQGRLRDAASMISGWTSDFELDLGAKLLMALGEELKRPDLHKRGLDLAEASFKDNYSSYDEDLMGSLIASGRGPRLEGTLIGALRSAMTRNGLSSPPAGQSAALCLAEFYFQIGKYQDVVTLLEKFPGWQAPDLRYLASAGRGDVSTLYMAAKSLAKVGRLNEALRILRYELSLRPWDDDLYALFLNIDPRGAARAFSELEREFPLESRPLIWMAAHNVRSGDLKAAESRVRRAIALDPDDMEAWDSGSRFKAYGVLAQIEKAKGRLKEARFLGRYSQSADLMRRASKYEAMGLYQQAIALYRRDLALLPNDFGAHLMLGAAELRIGRQAEASRHIGEALRHIPARSALTDYGPASQLLYIPKARQLARLALEARVKHGSTNPGVWAFLGEVRSQEGDAVGAIQCYQMVTRLDPDSLFGWSGLSGFMGLLPPDLARRVSSNLIRLGDPAAQYRVGHIPDFAECWLDSARAASRRVPRERALFELPASRAVLASTSDAEFVNGRLDHEWESGLGPPAELLARDSLIELIASLIQGT